MVHKFIQVALPAEKIIRLSASLEWINRFQISLGDDDGIAPGQPVIIIAQHRQGSYWGCNCSAWAKFCSCEHLAQLGIPDRKQPCDVSFLLVSSEPVTEDPKISTILTRLHNRLERLRDGRTPDKSNAPVKRRRFDNDI